MIAYIPNTLLNSSSWHCQKQRKIEFKKLLFIPSFTFNIAQLCKIKRQTTAIYRLAGGKEKKKSVKGKNKKMLIN